MKAQPEELIEEVERKVRKMRAAIYGECSDNNWIACRDNWMRPDSIAWLLRHEPICETKRYG